MKYTLFDLLRVGARTAFRYTGVVIALWIAQALITGVAIVGVSQTLVASFGNRPLLDAAVDGDVAALLELVRDAPDLWWGPLWILVGATLMWVVASWFLAGGVIGVLLERPEGRAATARCFGAAGANSFLAYVLLGFYGWVGYVPAVAALSFGATWASAQVQYALTMPEVIRAVVVGVTPALVLGCIASTVVAYARVELSMRRPDDDVGALGAYARAWRFVLSRPLTVVHSLSAVLLWIAVAAVYVWLSHGRAMLGTGGALALLMIRQGVGLARVALKVGLIAGQVALGQERMPPPRKPVRVTA